MPYETVAVDPARWPDLERLFGPNGAYSNCWCTWFLLTGRRWEEAGAAGRRTVLRDVVASGAEPGLLAYDGDDPVGWCAVGPREWYDRMTSPRALVYRPPDDLPAWVINCFFVAREHRRAGVAAALLDAAVDHAFSRGAARIDAYPLDTAGGSPPASSLYVGTLDMFRGAGFREIARIRDRPVVRRER